MKGYHTKRIALPGGKVIEIVYFHDPVEDELSVAAAEAEAAAAEVPAPLVVADDAREPEAAAEEVEPDPGLHLCPECLGELVYPVAWEERDGDRWQIDLRCPNCEWRHRGEYDQATVEEFDDVLNEGTEHVLGTLRALAKANMEADVKRLVDAINRDLIQPMDF